MSTHQDWLEAKGRRETAALLTVRYMNNGLIMEAKSSALEARAIEAEMTRIEAEIDGAA